MTNPFPPATDGVEINLSNDIGQGGNWADNAQTSLTNSHDTASGFKSMDYVPGHGGGDFGAPGDVGVPGVDTPHDGFGGEGQLSPEDGSDIADVLKKVISFVILLGVIVALGYIGLSFLDGEGVSIQDLINNVQGIEEPDLDSFPTSPPKRQPTRAKPAKPKNFPGGDKIADEGIDAPGNTFLPPVPVNPQALEEVKVPKSPRKVEISVYSYIPNSLPEIEPMSRIWSAQEEQVWRVGITNRYPWQRYKTVLEVKSSRLVQSRVILWDALDDTMFWTRMRAVMALAEFGVPVKKLNVDKALGDARPSLVANFVKRFIVNSSPGERYVLKHAIKMINPAARVFILKAFKRAGFQKESLDYYPVAALEDPDMRVRTYARSIVNTWGGQRLKNLQTELEAFKANPAFREEELKVIEQEEPETTILPDTVPIEVDEIQMFDDSFDDDDIDYEDVPDYDVEFDDF
ncbi:MAG: hypothetical protein AB8G05_04280 [Oligoflexales bacterium]